MSRFFSGSNQFMKSTGTLPANLKCLLIWINQSSVNQQDARFLSLNDGGNANRSVLGTDVQTSTSGKLEATQVNPTTSGGALSAVAATAATWQLGVAQFLGGANSQVIFLAGGNKKVSASPVNPAVTMLQVGGRGNATLAHAAAFNRGLTDLEVAAASAVFLNPRALGPAAYYYVNASTTENDLIGTLNLTVTGSSAGASDPNIATWFTGSAIANQSWTQGSAITSIDLTTKFDNSMASAAPWTGTIKQLGNPGTNTNAVGGGSSVTQITTAAALTTGQWVKVGTNALTPVLYASGTTALLGTALSWADGDTVTPYPVQAVTGLTSNGVTVNGSNVLTGTPGAGAVGTYNNLLFQATNNTNAAAIAYSNLFNATVASSAAAPSFSAGPTLTNATTDGYVYGATSNQTATWYTCVLVKGSATPTATQVRTGSPTGFISRFNTALTQNVAGALTVTGLTFPFHDVYHVLNNGNGDSAVVSNLALFKLPAAGQQYVTLALNPITAISKANPAVVTTSAPHTRNTGNWIEISDVAGMTQINGAWTTCTVIDGTHYSLDGIDSTGYSTYTSGGNQTWGRSSITASGVTNGDILQADVTDGQGNGVTFTPEGVALFATTSTARQKFTRDVYDVSAGAFIGSAPDYENDSPPIPPGQGTTLPYVLFPLGQTVTQSIAAKFTDPQGDDLTQPGLITALTSLPANRTLTNGSLSGTATVNAVTAVTFQAQNNSGESATAIINVVDGGVVAPNAIGLQASDADQLTQNLLLQDQFGTQDDPNPAGPAPVNTVIAQTPAAGTLVAPGSLMSYTLSSGNSALPGGIVITGPVSKSPQLRMEEGLNSILSYGIFKPFGVCQFSSKDTAGQIYRFFRLPAAAIVTTLEVMNDANPGATYKLGLLKPNGGSTIVTNSDAILFPSLSLDSARAFWADIFVPASVSGPALVSNVGKRVWELLGFKMDPTNNPQQASQDAFYDVALTCLTPGTGAGSVAIRMEYSRGPDRGLIPAAGTIGS